MRIKRLVKELYNRDNYEILVNPENGRECYVPITQKHINRMLRACRLTNRMHLIRKMNETIRHAFDTEEPQI